jgi:hypothetical protein
MEHGVFSVILDLRNGELREQETVTLATLSGANTKFTFISNLRG